MMTCEGCGSKRLLPFFRYHPGIHLKGLRKTTKDLARTASPQCSSNWTDVLPNVLATVCIKRWNQSRVKRTGGLCLPVPTPLWH